ncbi:Rha family transcriptional regulator [Novosphingobium resinovorum]|uniref:Rha family transcriptional regulator n=1 Tax=Novosphingobium resinovorum TaxID=158500 RepID=UPI002ED5DB07|nr:Rha family transcriptional regulator [Novosphingobium resinovorum]
MIVSTDGMTNMPVVVVKDGTLIVDSRNVAAVFGKRHDHVLDKIDDLLRNAPILDGPNFRAVPYEDGKGEMRRGFEMDQAAFSLLAMRFTGTKALRWQIAYVSEFERMRALLRPASTAPSVVDAFAPAARSTLGGIVKRVTHAELQEAFGQVLPALVEPMLERMVSERLLSGRAKVIEGISALEVAEMAGYTKGKRPRGLIQFITHRLKRYHLDRGVIPPLTPQGSSKVAVYIETIARRWLIEGGRKAIEMYVAEKRGQGRLRLVDPV